MESCPLAYHPPSEEYHTGSEENQSPANKPVEISQYSSKGGTVVITLLGGINGMNKGKSIGYIS